MNKRGFTFDRARSLVKTLLIVAGVLCLLGLLVNSSSETWAMYAVFGAIGCIVLALAVVFMGLKCPYCGKQIFRNCLVATTCPHCHRNLASGLKVKKKRDR